MFIVGLGVGRWITIAVPDFVPPGNPIVCAGAEPRPWSIRPVTLFLLCGHKTATEMHTCTSTGIETTKLQMQLYAARSGKIDEIDEIDEVIWNSLAPDPYQAY